ncbi:MAG: hypothetical protein HC888_04820 [Candidatus Competibacteraceae bacterium]|nr:hypothetical protein [Candidatus Competibacteraceae bacterium]
MKPGDAYHACDGLNHRVASIEPVWYNPPHTKGWIAVDVDIHSDDSGICGVGTCVDKPYTKAEMLKYVPARAESLEYYRKTGWFAGFFLIAEKIREGVDVFDEEGVLLPEWEKKYAEAQASARL